MIQRSPFPILPEWELILCCATTAPDDERLNRIRSLLETRLNWDYLLTEAGRHGLLSLLYSNLGSKFAEYVPELSLNTLRDYFRKNAISNLLMTGEMFAIHDLLEEHGVAAIPFKGPTLAAAAYGDITLREFRDIDLLLHQEDVLNATRLLAAGGYAADHQLSKGQEGAYLKSENECGLKGGAYLELQWNIVPGNYLFRFNDDELWENLGHMSIEGRSVPVLSAEDLLLLLCVHASKQSWKRLSWMCDVAQLIRARTDMDWDRLFDRASRLGGRRMLSAGLILANKVLSTAMPRSVIEQARADRVARTLSEHARMRLFNEKTASYEVLRDSIFYIRSRERMRDKAGCCVRMALSPTMNNLRSLPLPRPLFFLYYPLRPIRLLGKYLLG